jgi:hypothetical protein
MTTRTDSIGVWNDLGSVVPQYKQWIKFPNLATGGNATLLLNYTSPNWDKLNSYLLVRPIYVQSIVGIASRIYPDQSGNLIEIPIPEDLQLRFADFRNFEIRKVLRWRRRIGVTPDASYIVKLEELWS